MQATKYYVKKNQNYFNNQVKNIIKYGKLKLCSKHF